MTTRTGSTRQGKTVPLNSSWRISGGWLGYVLDARGFAVQVFVPGEDASDVIEAALKSA